MKVLCALFAWTGLTAFLSVSVIKTVDRKLCPITCIVCATGQLQRDRNLHIDSFVLFVAVGLLSASSSTDHRLLPSAPIYGLEDGRMDITYYMEADSLVLSATQPEEEERRINLTLLYEIITFIRNIIHCFKLRGIKLLFITINNCLPSKNVAEFYSSSWAAPSLPLLLHSVIE